MEFYIGDSIVSEEPFHINGEQTESLYFTDLDTQQTFAYGQTPEATYFPMQMHTQENPYIINWNGEDCYAWAESVCRSCNIDCQYFNLSSFRNTTGEDLMTYSCDDFCNLSNFTVGKTLYDEFQNKLGSDTFLNSSVLGTMSSVPNNDFQLPESSDLTDLSLEVPLDMDSLDKILAEQEHFDSYNYPCPVFQDGPVFVKTEDSSNSYDEDLFREVPFSPESQASLPSPSSCPPSSPSPPPSPSGSTYGSDVLGKIKTTSRKRERGPKNWEYLMRLLIDEEYNPSVIRWEDERAHTFRIVRPAEVAQIWGRRSKKPNLTYDNFARGLRYHYTTGALQAVSERQLVYRCGPKALHYLSKELRYRKSS